MDSQGIEPRGEQVLIRPSKDSVRGTDVLTEMRGGSKIVLTDDRALEKARTGCVLARGPKCTTVHAGDFVLFPRYAGMEFRLEEGDSVEMDGLRLIKESELLATLYEC